MTAIQVTMVVLADVLMFYWGAFVTKVRYEKKFKKLQEPKPLELRCLCGHLYTSHEPGKCKSSVWTERESYTDEYGYQWKACVCHGYMGPDPSILGLWTQDYHVKGQDTKPKSNFVTDVQL